MILPAIRQLTDWFSGAVTGHRVSNDAGNLDCGINACIDLLSATSSLDAGDTVPPDVTVVDETRNALAARGQPDTLPAVIVSAMPSSIESAVIQPTTGPLGGPIKLLVRVVLEQSDSDEGVEDAYYILRAVLKSWQYFTQNQTKWTRGDTAIIPLRDGTVEFIGMDANRDDKKIVTGFIISLQLRLTTP